MEKKRQQVMSTRDPQMSGNFELKGAEGGVQLPYSGKDITSKHAPLVEDVAVQDNMEELNLGPKCNGPQSTWKVCMRTRKHKRGNGSGVVEGKETYEDTSLHKDMGRADAGLTNVLRPASPNLEGGSGLKEVATWDANMKRAYNEGSTSSSIYKSLRSCDAMMDAAYTWELAKNMGVSCGKDENGVLTRMVGLDGRDKYEFEKLGKRKGDQ